MIRTQPQAVSTTTGAGEVLAQLAINIVIPHTLNVFLYITGPFRDFSTAFCRGDSSSVVGEDEDGQPVYQAVWSFRNSTLQDPDAMSAIAELTTGKDGIKLKMHDPKAAIKQLAEMQGWEAPKKSEVSGPGGGPVKTETVAMTPQEAADAYKKLMG